MIIVGQIENTDVDTDDLAVTKITWKQHIIQTGRSPKIQVSNCIL